MDVNDLRVAVTVTGFVLFLVLVVHTYSRRRRADHEAAAMLPFQGDDGAVDNTVDNSSASPRDSIVKSPSDSAAPRQEVNRRE